MNPSIGTNCHYDAFFPQASLFHGFATLKIEVFKVRTKAATYPTGLWDQIFIIDFASISRKFPADPRLFLLKTKKYLHRHPIDC